MYRRLLIEKKKAIKVMMPPSIIQQLQAAARRESISMNEFIRIAVIKRLTEQSSRDSQVF